MGFVRPCFCTVNLINYVEGFSQSFFTGIPLELLALISDRAYSSGLYTMHFCEFG